MSNALRIAISLALCMVALACMAGRTDAAVTADVRTTAQTSAPVVVQGCVGPDIRCELQDAATGAIDDLGSVASGIGLPDPGDAIDGVLGELGNAIAEAAATAWTSAMLAIWNAGLFVLKVVLNFAESFMTPDLSEDGPGRDVYAYTLWIAGALVVLMAMLQLGVAAFQRNGKSLATMLIGTAQFVVVWSAWAGYCVIVVTACSGLTTALMEALLDVSSWPEWDPAQAFSPDDVTDATVATVLGLLGMVLWVAAIGHLLVLLTRAAALIVLAATGAISAAGLVSDVGRSWFWKSLRWFHAAALTPVVMVLVLGIGVQLATGVASGLTDGTQAAIGTALPSVVLICISCVAPLALFKLLAFVDPGTPSGASVRAGLAGVGGVSGLMSGGAGGDGGGGAGSSDSGGSGSQSSGEAASDDDTSARFAKSLGGNGQAGGFAGLGPVMGAGASVLAGVAAIGAKGASIGTDLTNQMGVGHHGYQPDFSTTRNQRSDGQRPPRLSEHDDQDADQDADRPDDADPPDQAGPPEQTDLAATSTVPVPPSPTGGPASGSDHAGSAGGTPKPAVPGGGAGGGGAAAGGAVPPPV